MHYTISEVVNYLHDGESSLWHNVKIYDLTDEELAEIKAVIVRLYDAHVQKEMAEELAWKERNKKEC